MPPNILQKILETKRKEVQALLGRTSLDELKALARGAEPPRNFFSAVTAPPKRLVNLIAEVKKASPSAGVLRPDFDAVQIARQYEQAGAQALSVLTDEEYFQGDLAYIQAVKQAVSLPVLRKDFIIEPCQVHQSRAAGADAILLIAAAVPGGKLLDLMILSTELRMTVLVEVHGADELMQVRSMIGFPHAAYSLLGINNRNLETFETDLGATIRLTHLLEPATPVVSESGIKTRRDVERLAAAGVRAILVGETFMRSKDIPAAVDLLMGEMPGGDVEK